MTGMEVGIGRYSSGWFLQVVWSPDGTRLASGASGTQGGELFVWDLERGQRLHSFAGHATVAWAASGERLISAGGYGTLRC